MDRLISADERGSRNTAVPNHSDRNKPDDSVTSNGGRGAGKDKGKIQESAEFQAEGDRDGNVTMGEEEDETDSLAPEEPPAPVSVTSYVSYLCLAGIVVMGENRLRLKSFVRRSDYVGYEAPPWRQSLGGVIAVPM